jgi:uncharacterized protein (DUF58 family)
VVALGVLALALWWAMQPRPPALAAGGFTLLALFALDAASAWWANPGAVEARPVGTATADRPLTFLFRVPGLRRPVTVSLLDVPSGGTVASVLVTTDEPATGTLPRAPRGLLHWLAFEASVRGPLGLARAFRRHRAPGPVVIGPAPLRHDVDWGAAPSSLQPVPAPGGRSEELFRNVREYVPGDPRRSVHWRATAHHGRLMVREADEAGVHTVRIVVACGTHGPRTEDALARALWAAEDAWRRGWQVRLVTCEAERGPLPAPPLRRSSGPIPPSLHPPPGTRTVDGAVLSRTDLARRLATATPGEPVDRPRPALASAVTLRITDEDDTAS